MPDTLPPAQPAVSGRTNAWLIALLLVVSVGGLSFGWLHIERQSEALKVAVSDLRVAVEQQGSLMNRVLGKVVPINLPEGVEEGLAGIERELGKHETLLTSSDQVKALAEKLAVLVQGLPTWVQSELFSRILPARWQLDALQLLQRGFPGDLDDLQDLADDLSAHALNRPQGAPEVLEKLLLKRVEEVNAEAVEREKVLNEARAKENLRQGFLSRIQSIESDTALFERLRDPELKERLGASIHLAVQDLQISAIAANLQEDALSQKINSLAVEASKSLQALRAEEVHKQRALVRKYQLWALGQLADVPELKTISDKKVAAIPEMIERNNPLGKVRKEAEKEAQADLVRIMIEKLSVIDTRLLDDAVGEWHRKVFSSRFASLDEAHQLRVVGGFANATKRTMEELP